MINLNRFGSKWITSKENLWGIAEIIFNMKHIPIVPKGNEKFVRDAGKVEQKAANIKEWGERNTRTSKSTRENHHFLKLESSIAEKAETSLSLLNIVYLAI